jgi:membrane-bound lytic murein transglycosylase D
VLTQRSFLPASVPVSPPPAEEPSDSKRLEPSPAATAIDQRTDPNIKQIQDLMDRATAMFDEAERLSRDGKLNEAKRRLKQSVDLVQSSSFSMLQYPHLERFYLNLKRDAGILEASLAEETNLTHTPEDKPDQHLEAAAVDALPNINLYQIQVHPSLVSAVSDQLSSVQFGIPISVNDRVLRMLEYFQNRWHDAMQHGLHESGKYMPLFQKIFDEAGVPRELIHVAQVESLYKPLAYSRARAKGIWQFTRAAAYDYSLKLDRWMDERSDIEKSTRAAARYLKELHQRFGDWHTALAAYNCGPARFERLQARYGNLGYWEISDRGLLPAETVNYVPSVLATIIIASNPERYGFLSDFAKPLEFERVNVARSVRLSDVAEIARIDLELLKELNPELMHLVTPPDYPGYQLKVPLGLALELADQVVQLPEAPSIPMQRHRVRRGETMATVARHYHVTAAELAAINHLPPKSRLKRNSFLTIPGGGYDFSTSRSFRAGGKAASYRVRRGDTWGRVSRTTGLSVAQLKKLNQLGPKARLHAGLVLSVRPTSARPSSLASAASRKSAGRTEKLVYRVRKGDTVDSIAKRYGTDAKMLQRWNRVAKLIRPGQRLTILVTP